MLGRREPLVDQPLLQRDRQLHVHEQARGRRAPDAEGRRYPDAESHFFFRVNGPTPYGAIVLQDDGDPNDGAFNGPEHTVDVVAGTYNVSAQTDRWRRSGRALRDLFRRVADLVRADLLERERDVHLRLRAHEAKIVAYEYTAHTGGHLR